VSPGVITFHSSGIFNGRTYFYGDDELE
jgi:hypothetical protein